MPFNLASDSRRQAGSAFKVFTLAAALERASRSIRLARPALADHPRPAVPQRDRGVGRPQLRRRRARHMTLAQAIAHR